MPHRDLVVIGASAGGIPALQSLLQELPADFPAAILIVLHLSPHSAGLLPEILARAGPLPATNARHGEPIENGHIYVAPPDMHLLADANRRIRIGHGPKENRFRPAVDPLFRSAALNYGSGVIGIILSGGLDDGTAGLRAVKQAGGLSIVQEPADAESSSMPISAMRHVKIDFCLPAAKIGVALARLARETNSGKGAAMPDQTRFEVEVAADERNVADIRRLGEPSTYTCPTCHGSLFRVADATPTRFRCHTGHAYTAVTLDSELRTKVEDATWNAIRTLQEHIMLLQELTREPGFSDEQIAGFNERADEAAERATMLREALALADESPERPE